jgi:hypothetical protein
MVTTRCYSRRLAKINGGYLAVLHLRLPNKRVNQKLVKALTLQRVKSVNRFSVGHLKDKHTERGVIPNPLTFSLNLQGC